MRDSEAVELAEALGFLLDWLDADSSRLAKSLYAFVGPSFPLGELRDDLQWLSFLVDRATA